MVYINIHRHGIAADNEFGIENIYKIWEAAPTGYYSAGLHPWYIKQENWKQDFNKLESLAPDACLLAIGECGLDKVCATSFELQEKVFAAQIDLANRINKPLIVHCVRAFAEVLILLNKHNNKVPVIFHGFNKSRELAEQLVAKGFYLSYGKALQKPAIQPIFSTLPLTQIFLETDDATIAIESIYNWAAEARSISTEELSLQLQQNLQKVFNILL